MIQMINESSSVKITTGEDDLTCFLPLLATTTCLIAQINYIAGWMGGGGLLTNCLVIRRVLNYISFCEMISCIIAVA